ncbi:hypothetical protein DGWBC_0881 [Dehalogenimonas sp. WBC-2]|nr:hypothetical protein DGWBC_0881 [Dehalogenimonas sp. WBC-2]
MKLRLIVLVGLVSLMTQLLSPVLLSPNLAHAEVATITIANDDNDQTPISLSVPGIGVTAFEQFFPTSSIVNLTDGAQAETYALDSWVVKNGPNDYEMWYTHVKTSLDLFALIDSLKPLLTSQILEDLAALDLPGLIQELVIMAQSSDFDTLWNLIENFTTVVGYATSSNGIDWTVVDDEVYSLGNTLWNAVAGPRVVKNADNDYEIWFTHGTSNLSKSEFQTLLVQLGDSGTIKNATLELLGSTRTMIGYATSTDGIIWTPQADDVIHPSTTGIWDSTAAGSVVKTSSTEYQMWYSHALTDLTDTDLDEIIANLSSYGITEFLQLLDGTSMVIGYATSIDGQNWVIENPYVISETSGIWNSIATPSVIINNGVYEMWFTRLETNLVGDDISTLLDIVLALKPQLSDLWDSFSAEDFELFISGLDDLLVNQIDDLRALVSQTSTVIGYATSPDGENWDVAVDPVLSGPVSSPWGSIGLPCVVLDGGIYEIWYTRGTGTLDAQFLVDLLQGTFPLLAYTSTTQTVVSNISDGWNLFGLPVMPASTATGDVLGSILSDLRTVWTYNAVTMTWSYYTTISGAPQGGLTSMELGRGYWIQLNTPAIFTITGTEPSYPFSIGLVTGWNLISIPKTPSNASTGSILNGILENVRTVWAYDAATLSWSYFTTIPGAPQGGLTEMVEGKAYWIQMTAPDTLVLG